LLVVHEDQGHPWWQWPGRRLQARRRRQQRPERVVRQGAGRL